MGTAIGAVSLALGASVKATANYGDKVDELSQRTGIATGLLQEMAYGAQFSGISMDELAISMGHLAKTGIKDVRAEMFRLADQFAKMPDGGAKTALAMAKFGRAGGALIPYLNELAKKGKLWREELDQMGGIMPPEMIAQGAEFNDSVDKLGTALAALRATVSGPFLEPLTKFMDRVRIWVGLNRQLIAQRLDAVIRGIAIASRVLWSVFKGFARTLDFMLQNWKLFAILIGSYLTAEILTHAAAVLFMGKAYTIAGVEALIAAGKAALAWAVAAAPVFLVAAALALVALAVEDVYTWLDGGDSVIGRWVDLFKVRTSSLKVFFDDMLGSLRLSFEMFISAMVEKTASLFGVPKAFAKLAAAELAHGVTSWIPVVGQGDSIGVASRFAAASAGPAGPAAGQSPLHTALDGYKLGDKNEYNITVQGGNGSPREIADEVRKTVKEIHDTQSREILQAVR